MAGDYAFVYSVNRGLSLNVMPLNVMPPFTTSNHSKLCRFDASVRAEHNPATDQYLFCIQALHKTARIVLSLFVPSAEEWRTQLAESKLIKQVR